MEMETRVLQQLRKSVCAQFEKEITTSADCANLAAALTGTFNVNISSQTLRRFFGLIKSDSAFSRFTLDLLSRFCGYTDFIDFTHAYSNTELQLFFGDTENTNQNYWEKSAQLIKQISVSPQLLVTTHHRLMAFPMARKYFMQHHPSRDLICTVYAQYFLAYLKYNRSNEARMFAYGFLFKGAYLQQNTEFIDLLYEKVRETQITDDVPCIPAALKFGVQLLYADYKGDDALFRKYFTEMKKVRLRYIAASEKSVCSFESTVLESLIFTNRLKEIKFLLDNNTPQKHKDKDYIPLQRIQTHEEVWKILCAGAYHKLNDPKKRQFYLDQVNLENLETGWVKYYSIMFYFIKLKTVDSSEHGEIFCRLEELIGDMYSSYYENLLSEYIKSLPVKGQKYCSA